jgi:uncharacterized damage-inducible protein DinB
MIVSILEGSRDALREAVADIPEDGAARSPGAGRWSVLEVVEHLAIAERGMLSAFERARASETSLENKEREAEIMARLSDREARREAPERARPAGRFATLAQAFDQFLAARAQTIELARTRETDLYRLTVMHPFFGEVNGHEMLLIMAGHARRHAEQIREIQTAAQPRST